MKTLKVICLLAILALFNLSPALADNHNYEPASRWSTTVGGGVILFENDEEYKSGQTYEVRQGYDLCDKCTLEFGITGGPFFEGPDLARFTGEKAAGGENWSLGANVAMLRHINGNPLFVDEDPTGKWDPYAGVVAGAFWYKKSTNDGHWDPYAGLEAGTNYFLNSSWSLRGDYRALVVGENTEINHQLLFSVGYRWGSDSSTGGSSRSGGGFGEGGLRTVYFDFDKATLKPETRERLDKNADWLLANEDKQVTLEGHCDERGTNEYNLALGDRRSQSVYDYLRAKGVSEKQLSTISYGEEKPAVDGQNEAAWSKNRRVECVIK